MTCGLASSTIHSANAALVAARIRLEASALRSFWTGGILLAVAFVRGPVGERRRAVLEANNEFPTLLSVLLGDEVMAGFSQRRQDKHTVLALGGLYVAVLAFGSIHQLEVYAHGLLLVGRPQAESVVAQVLVRLDVVLVLVGPMERDLLALVGDCVDAWLVDALGEKVALGVVAAEEAEQVVVDLALQRFDVHRIRLQPDAQVFDLLRRLRIDAKPLRLLNGLA